MNRANSLWRLYTNLNPVKLSFKDVKKEEKKTVIYGKLKISNILIIIIIVDFVRVRENVNNQAIFVRSTFINIGGWVKPKAKS